MIKVERTTFSVEGTNEPCIIVSNHDGFVKVRISKCHHYLGRDTLYMREEIDGEYNASDEFKGDYDLLTDKDAIRLAREFSAYIN